MTEENIAFVSMGTPEEAERYRAKLRIVHPIFCDTNQEIYRQFGLGAAKAAQVLSARVVARAAGHLVRGNLPGRPPSDPKQLGGAFRIEPDGRVSWMQNPRDISDVLKAAEAKRVLGSVRE